MPDWNALVRNRLAQLQLTPAEDADLTEEVAQHLEDRYRELRDSGAGEQEAMDTAIAELDDVSALRARRQVMPRHDPPPAGDPRRGNAINDLWRDLRFAFRAMRKSPVVVMFVVATLALGIGANTTIFTLINTLILNPLPVPRASELISLSGAESANSSKSAAALPVSYADLKDYRERNSVFQSLAGYTSARTVTRQEPSGSNRMFCELVTGDYFSTLSLTPARGRFFLPEEDSTPGTHPVTVINYGTWQTQFGAGDDIVGRTVRLNNLAFTIIGVAPARFIGVNAIFGPDFWIPAAMAERLLPNEMQKALTDRSRGVFQGVGRLKPGVSQAQAQANLSSIAAGLAREFSTNESLTIQLQPVRDVLFTSASSGSGPFIMASIALLVVAAIVLLIACSNVANLLLARSVSRRQEMAVRLAMGASRPRLVRQLLTESMVLAILSGAAGLALGYSGIHAVFSALPGSSNFPVPRLDTTVLAYALAISLATGFIFGAMPAFRSTAAGLAEALKEGARAAGRSRKRVTIANALLVGQVALSFLLLILAALFLRSIGHAYQMDAGFQTAHLEVMMTNPGQAGYSRPQTKAFYDDARARAERIPGVESVSWASNLPLWSRPQNGIVIEGREQRSRTDTIRSIVNIVDVRFFETAGIPLERGRPFGGQDQETSLPVAIVNEKVARDFWQGDALGKRLQIPGEKQMRQVIGVARTATYSTWGEPPQLCVYVPLQQRFGDSMNMYIRTKGDPLAVASPVEREIRASGPEILVFVRSRPEFVDNGLFQAKMGVMLMSIFGLLALGLASIGLYGILAYSVNQRQREIGLRMALGATRASVLRLVLTEGMGLVVTGVVIGFAASMAIGRLLTGFLFGVSAGDPLSIASAGVTLTLVALLACYLPARWATRVDPLRALREG